MKSRKVVSMLLVMVFLFNVIAANNMFAADDGGETVSSDGTMSTSLVLDENGFPHIAYCDDASGSWIGGDLKYAYNDGTQWHIETVDSGNDVGMYASLAIDKEGGIHISYYDGTDDDLKYAYHDREEGSSWNVTTIDGISIQVGKYTSLEIDGDGNICISYYDDTNDDLKVAYYDYIGANNSAYGGLFWFTDTIDSDGSVGEYTSLAIDGNNRVHISYFDDTNYNLKYAYYDGSSWAVQTVDNSGDIGKYGTSIAVDGADGVHISYYTMDTWSWISDDLKYAYSEGSGSSDWEIEIVDSSVHVGEDSFIALDKNDIAHILYFEDINGNWSSYNLKYAYDEGTDWQIDTLVSDEDMCYGSLAIDSNNFAHISYSVFENDNWENGVLKYLTKDVSPIISVDNTVDVNTIQENKIHEEILEITNDGITKLEIEKIVTSSDTVTVEDVEGVTIGSGEILEVQVLILPTVLGTFSETLDIYSNDPDTPIETVTLSGTVTYSESNADLADLVVVNGSDTIDINFDKDQAVYDLTSEGQLEALTITATTVNPDATITLDDITTTGTTTQAITLEDGDNLIPILVTSEDDTIERAYVLAVNGIVNDADLTDLTVDAMTVDDFDKDDLSYNIEVENTVDSIDITATSSDDQAIVLINGAIYDGGSESIDLEVGDNDIEVMVIAQDGTTKTYTITATRKAANTDLADIDLSDGSINETVTDGTYNYTATVDYEVDYITVTPDTEDNDATTVLKVNGEAVSGSIDLDVGDNTVTIVVTGEDGVSESTYKLVITREEEVIDPVVIKTSSLDSGTVGESYSDTISAEGGATGDYVFTATGLPSGMTIDADTGEISGTVYTSGTYDVKIKVYDSGASDTETLELTINPQVSTGKYTITPVSTSTYTNGTTTDAIVIMTVNDDVSGYQTFSITVESVTVHDGTEDVVFVQMRDDEQISINVTTADFEVADGAKAGFNVKAGDVIKVFIVDEITGSDSASGTVLQ